MHSSMKPGIIELLGLLFVYCVSTKLTSNKGSICRIAQQGDGIKDTSLKTGWWRSKYHAYRALKSAKLASKCNKKYIIAMQQSTLTLYGAVLAH